MYAFQYERATSIDEARRCLSAAADAKLLAGGQTLLASLKLRLAQPDCLVDLSRIEDLRGIQVQDGKLSVGAMTPHAVVAESPDVKRLLPALAGLASQIGDPMVRNRGTLGGSIANNDPSADYPAALVGLGATVVTDHRAISADEFFLGMFETALQPHELVVRVEFPLSDRAAYIKFKHPASRFALVGVFVSRTAQKVRVAVTGAGACVFRVPQMEEALERDFNAEAIADVHVDESELNSDLHATAAYRAHLVNVLARRAVQATLE